MSDVPVEALDRAIDRILADKEFRFGFTPWRPREQWDRELKEYIITEYQKITGRDPYADDS